jgi:hypothetical protein
MQKSQKKHVVFSERLFDSDKKTLLRVLKVRFRSEPGSEGCSINWARILNKDDEKMFSIKIYISNRICRVSVPETWTRYTEENIRRALSEISQSDELLNGGNQLMATSNNDMWSQWNHVNVSLENRVQEEQVAKNKTQAHLEKVSFL